MNIEKIKDNYFSQCKLFKDLKRDYFSQLISHMSDDDKQQLKILLVSKIKEIIAQRTNNGNLFQTETNADAQQQYSQTILDNFRICQ